MIPDYLVRVPILFKLGPMARPRPDRRRCSSWRRHGRSAAPADSCHHRVSDWITCKDRAA